MFKSVVLPFVNSMRRVVLSLAYRRVHILLLTYSSRRGMSVTTTQCVRAGVQDLKEEYIKHNKISAHTRPHRDTLNMSYPDREPTTDPLDFYLRTLAASAKDQGYGRRTIRPIIAQSLNEDILEKLDETIHEAMERLEVLFRREKLERELAQRARLGTLHDIEPARKTFLFKDIDDDPANYNAVLRFQSSGQSPYWQVMWLPATRNGWKFSTCLPMRPSAPPTLGEEWPPLGDEWDAVEPIPHLPYNLQHRVLLPIQSLLECAFFEFCQRRAPQVLERRAWVFPEQLELNACTKELAAEACQNPALLCDGEESAGVLRDLDEIRHCTVHRQSLSVGWLLELLDNARLTLLMLEGAGRRYYFVEEIRDAVRQGTDFASDLQFEEEMRSWLGQTISNLCADYNDILVAGSKIFTR
jgi:hypothetical protein